MTYFSLLLTLLCYKLTEATSFFGNTLHMLRNPGQPYPEDWYIWKRRFQKIYHLHEEPVKFNIWASNVYQISIHNLRFTKGREFYMQTTTKFTDQTPQVLMSLPEVSLAHIYQEFSPVTLPTQEVADYKNWAQHGWTRPVKSYDFSTDGWAFSATAACASQIYNVTGIYNKLSMKEIIDCIEYPPLNQLYPYLSLDAFAYIQRNGVTLESFYGPCEVERAPCKRNFKHPRRTIQGYYLLEPDDEENLKRAVALIGPISVSIRVTLNFFFYDSGVFYDFACANSVKTTNHAVLLVGYGSDSAYGEFWIILNNWGNQWGEKGYARLSRNSVVNCGIAEAAIYPVV